MSDEKIDNGGDFGRPTPNQAAFTLDEKRRAALAEVDNAKFSCAFSLCIPRHTFQLVSIGGSTSELASSQVLVSSLMPMISLLSISVPAC